jgi:hypothetical protein
MSPPPQAGWQKRCGALDVARAIDLVFIEKLLTKCVVPAMFIPKRLRAEPTQLLGVSLP